LTVSVSEQDLDRAVELGLIDANVREKLLAMAKARLERVGHGHFDLTNVLWLVGVVSFAFATLMLFRSFESAKEHLESVLLSGALLLVSVYSSERLRRRRLLFLSAASSVMTGIYAIVLGFSMYTYGEKTFDLKDSLFHIGVMTTIVGGFEMTRRRYPASIVILWIGLASLGYTVLGQPSGSEAELFKLHLGWITLLAAYLLNLTHKDRNYTFWLNKVGLIALASGLALYVSETAEGATLVALPFLLWSVGLLCVAGILRYPSYLVTGIGALVTYLAFVINEMFPDSTRLMAVLVAALALLLVVLGTWLYQRRNAIDQALKRRLPSWVECLKPPSLPDPFFNGLAPDAQLHP